MMTIITSAAAAVFLTALSSSSSSSFYVAGQTPPTSSLVNCPASPNSDPNQHTTVRIHNNCDDTLQFWEGGPVEIGSIETGKCLTYVTNSTPGINVFNGDNTGGFDDSTVVFEVGETQFDGSFNAPKVDDEPNYKPKYGITIVNPKADRNEIVCLGNGYPNPDPGCYPPQSTDYPCWSQPCLSESYNHNSNLDFDLYWCNRPGEKNTNGQCGEDNCVIFTRRCCLCKECDKTSKMCGEGTGDQSCTLYDQTTKKYQCTTSSSKFPDPKGVYCEAGNQACTAGGCDYTKDNKCAAWPPVCGVDFQNQCTSPSPTPVTPTPVEPCPPPPPPPTTCNGKCKSGTVTKFPYGCADPSQGLPYYGCSDGTNNEFPQGECIYKTPVPAGFCNYYPSPTPTPDIDGPDPEPDACASIKDKRSCKKSGPGCKWKKSSRTCQKKSGDAKSSKNGKPGKSSKNKKLFE